uniref:Uncharacterized protein n=1 Tax=Lepeophtheirus salmonis TaxID=72036 RepID=A0A0K2U9J1_LEPSM
MRFVRCVVWPFGMTCSRGPHSHPLETNCLLTPRFLANLDKEVPGEALMDFWRPSRKPGVRIRSLLMLWAFRQSFPSTSQALKT